ncbi:hypothetical protein GCM10023189_10230 [Nibrella saemangeumensis]|uniref:Uncharacterized protein n=1 Tax=Nibrella saemangeumensis TaxID=1084526 RepID=A0ABP8MIN9_9BACT
METVERAEHMLVDTLGAFQHGTETKLLSESHGKLLIEGWLNALDGNLNLAVVRNTLRELRDELKKPSPNNSVIHGILVSLASQAHEAARTADTEEVWAARLEELSVALYHFSRNF